MKETIGLLALALAACMSIARLAGQESAQAGASPGTATLGEDLIYAVERTPERTFETARDVQVISHEEIEQLNVANLAQLLARQPGVGVLDGESGSMPFLRGLGGKQVLILIDGVKINNATWRGATKEYLKSVDVTQIERVEIVRGVVAVLGTESLGGVINIITKKGPARPLAGTIATRYATASRSTSTALGLAGTLGVGILGSIRYEAGGSFTNTGDVRAGGGRDQRQTNYQQTGGHLNGQWLLSPDRTVSFGYQNARVGDEPTPATGSVQRVSWQPAAMQLLRVSYHDLTSRGWEDSLQVTAHWNQQVDLRNVTFLPAIGQAPIHEHDRDALGGLNVELNSFTGRHHFVYGIDVTNESVRSGRTALDAAGHAVETRGNLMDQSRYRTAGLYLQDRFEPAGWLTVISGMRLARYQTRGSENNEVGHFDIDSSRTNLTGALNLIGHVTPHWNVIANAVHGYRAPNLDDVSHFSRRAGIIEVPNTMTEAEKVLSLEAGFKYDRDALSGALFYFRNQFGNLLIREPARYNGATFLDTNGNGIQDPGEPAFVSSQNVGNARIHGLEGDLAYTFTRGLTIRGSYSRIIGQDNVLHEPLSAIPPASGMVELRYAAPTGHAPWAAVAYRAVGDQDRLSSEDSLNPFLGGNDVPGYDVLDLRAGLDVSSRLALSLALENVFDERYAYIGSAADAPGRQLVFGAQLRF